MRKLVIIIFAISLLQVMSFSLIGAEAKPFLLKPQTPLIDYIKDDDVVDLCGCAFEHQNSNNTRGYTFSSDAEGKTAWMNIDGIDIKLKLTHSKGPKVAKKGSRFTETYETDGIEVLLVLVVTKLCIPYSPQCETINYDATITVTKDKRKESVKAKGQCGCV